MSEQTPETGDLAEGGQDPAGRSDAAASDTVVDRSDPEGVGGISDDQLPEDLQPGEDNPLANPLPDGESADLGIDEAREKDTESDPQEDPEAEGGGA